ncbi:MAG: hypothetical protein KDA75_16170 [Planctomycetaceae bacterium]|nr:hypothetical protein [Planctomycetaceae bacterium]
MFDQVLENLQKATESSIKLQQEMFQKWSEAIPGASVSGAAGDSFTQWRKKLEQFSSETLKRQKEMVDKNYDAGIEAIEGIFQVADAKDPQELQQKVTELYKTSFESLRKLSESQMCEFKAASEKLMELLAAEVNS